MNQDLILQERERFVIRGVVYKVIRRRPNGKLTIKVKGEYVPPVARQTMTADEKQEEQEFFKEKEELTDAKKDDREPGDKTVPGPEGSSKSGPKDQQPRVDSERPTFA